MVQMISESKRKIAALALAGAMAIGGAAGVATTMASPAQNQSGIVMEAEAENYDPYAYPEFTYNVWYDYVRLTVRNGNHNYQIAPGTQIIVDGGWTKDTKSKRIDYISCDCKISFLIIYLNLWHFALVIAVITHNAVFLHGHFIEWQRYFRTASDNDMHPVHTGAEFRIAVKHINDGLCAV